MTKCRMPEGMDRSRNGSGKVYQPFSMYGFLSVEWQDFDESKFLTGVDRESKGNEMTGTRVYFANDNTTLIDLFLFMSVFLFFPFFLLRLFQKAIVECF